MRLSIVICTMLSALLCLSDNARANPVEPMPVTKVFYVDSVHWAIEIDVNEMHVFYPIPIQTDTITLGVGAMDSVDVTMHACKTPVFLNNDSGTGVLTSDYYPDLKLKPGKTIFVGVKNGRYKDHGPTLSAELQPNTIIELEKTETTCGSYVSDGHVEMYYCTQFNWDVSECRNSGPTTNPVYVRLLGRSGMNLTSFTVEYATRQEWFVPQMKTITNENAVFGLRNFDTCSSYVVRFKKESFTFDCMLRLRKIPLRRSLASGPNIDVQIPFPPRTPVTARQEGAGREGEAVRAAVLPGSAGSQVRLVIADRALQGNGWCEIYTLGGALISSIPFICKGTGTYRIAVQGGSDAVRPASVSTCVCRIRIGRETVCTSFIAQ